MNIGSAQLLANLTALIVMRISARIAFVHRAASAALTFLILQPSSLKDATFGGTTTTLIIACVSLRLLVESLLGGTTSN